MDFNIVNKNDEIVMSLIHYFITEENYTPIVVRGVKDEIWLENLEGPYRIIRINSNYIHNEEQYQFDMFKTKKVMDQIKKRTLSINMNALNIFLNISDKVDIVSIVKNIDSVSYNNVEEIWEDKNLIELFPSIKDKFIKDKEGIDLLVNVTSDINAKTAKENETYANIFKPKKIIVTPILIGICIISFILMYIFGNGSEDINTLVMFGANVRSLIKDGEVWRLLTSIFLHIGLIHLICNMYSLYLIGTHVENYLGKIKYLGIYLGSGIIGSLLGVLLNSNVSAGASGAIYGLMGSLLYFGYNYRLHLGGLLRTQIIPILLLNLFISVLVPGINIFAHIGGLVGGYLLTSVLGIPGKDRKSDQVNSWIVLIILILFLSFMLYRY